jgi:hypothetical protein
VLNEGICGSGCIECIWHQLEVIYRPHDPAAFFPPKEPLYPTETVRAAEPVWTAWRGENPVLVEDRTPTPPQQSNLPLSRLTCIGKSGVSTEFGNNNNFSPECAALRTPSSQPQCRSSLSDWRVARTVSNMQTVHCGSSFTSSRLLHVNTKR